MEELFTTLTRAVEGTPAIALSAAFVWGILSILLSPCHLSSIPLIVGFIDQQGRMTARRAFLISTLFAVGILITIAGIGAITAAAGRMMGDVGRYGNYVVAAIFFVVGYIEGFAVGVVIEHVFHVVFIFPAGDVIELLQIFLLGILPVRNGEAQDNEAAGRTVAYETVTYFQAFSP